MNNKPRIKDAVVVSVTTRLIDCRRSLAGVIQPKPTIDWSKVTNGRLPS